MTKDLSQVALVAFHELFGSSEGFLFAVEFSGRFTPYNAQIQMRRSPIVTQITFKLSKNWVETDEELLKGLMQSLLVKMLGKRKKLLVRKTNAMDMYEIFIKKIGNYAPITKADAVLVDSFTRMNTTYFSGVIERPNLEWGGKTFRKLGHYNYHTDTIMIAETLRSRMDLVDYVMYHEMLHKKHKFYFKNGRSFHHHTAFRNEEAQYPNAVELEKELSYFVAKEKRAAKRAGPTASSDKRSILSWFLE